MIQGVPKKACDTGEIFRSQLNSKSLSVELEIPQGRPGRITGN